MVAPPLFGLARQTKPIIKKNLLYLLVRNWFPTLLQAAIIPIAILALTLNINNYGGNQLSPNAPPSPILSLRDSLSDGKIFVIVTPPGLASDVDDVVQKLTAQLSDIPDQIVLSTDAVKDPSQCITTFHGVSNCHAVLLFNDSPKSKIYNGTWNYTIKADVARSYDGHSIETIQLPLQLAVDKAITGVTEVPENYAFESFTYEQKLAMAREHDALAIGQTYAILFFLSYLPAIYHVANTITSERESGFAQLIDSMGGSPASRVLGATVTFGLLYLPCWILSGVLYWYIIFRESNAAIPIFWQIFSGWAITNSTIFAASFFKGSRISSVFIAGSFLALAGGAAILVNRYWVPLDNVRAIPLSLFFPSINYIFTLFHLTRFLVAKRLLDMGTGFVDLDDPMDEERFDISTSTFWGFLIIQIFLYPVLAILAERFIHGINTKGRAFTKDQDLSSTAAVEVHGLTKVYSTTWWKRIFFWRRVPELRALDGLDLVAQKRQIMCLLGVNGAGKSTTLDLLSGFMKQTSGSIKINGSGSTPLGICPQKNVLIEELTVLDHVRFWSGVKSGTVVDAEVEAIIAKCGLEEKKHSRAGKLSGGQKRKLQLACMFVGGSLVCLMDEVTTGLDPLSRRTIWDIILAERAKRSIIFTTHFLDEGDVLADHIVILSKGQIKCQGSGAELKTRFGGGYRVHLPHTDSIDKSLGLSPTVRQDRLVYRAEDSRSAAKLVSQLEAAGHKEVQMAGPTIEDVFLNLTKDDLAADEEEATAEPSSDDLGKQLSSGHRTTFWRQVSILLRKRITVLPRYWMSTLLALVLPIVCVPAINTFIPMNFARPQCRPTTSHNFINPLHYYSYASLNCDTNNNHCVGSGANPFGPRSVNDSLYNVLAHYPIGQVDGYGYQHGFNASTYNYSVELIDGSDEFKAYVAANNQSLYQGGLYVGDDVSPPLIASYSSSSSTTQALLNIWSQVKGGMPIAVYSATMNALAYGGNGYESWIYILYACFILAVYPSFFSLYPAYEKTHQIRALQYSNGVRPVPLWTAYFLFDFVFVLIVSIAFSMTLYAQFGPLWWEPLYMLPLCILYGITGILISYIVSLKAPSQLTAFLWTIGYMVFAFFVLALAYTIPQSQSSTDGAYVQRVIDIVSFTLDLVFPIGNMFRATGIGLNIFRLACRNDDMVTDPASIWGYGLPILYLCLQCLCLPFILIWADNDLSLSTIFRRDKQQHQSLPASDIPPTSEKSPPQVDTTETSALLSLSHVTKTFPPSSSPPAVSDLSLSLARSEILALLGPNGAGKTTVVNMIRGVLTPTSGTITVNSRSISATHTANLGVCPQFDALDLLTVRQHLEFYARIKGVADPNHQTDILMAKVGLTPFASRLASRLSGGNRRKLSLAIALTGNPDVLVLDEPSSAMDVAAKRRMWKVLADIAPGRSLLLTTHSMEEADALATRAAIIRGKLLAVGTTATLRSRYADLYHVHLVLRSAPTTGEAEMGEVEEWVRGEFGDVSFEGMSLGGQVKFMVGGKEGIGRLVEVLERERDRLGLADYSIGAPTLERVFLSVVREGHGGGEEEEVVRRKAWWRFGRG